MKIARAMHTHRVHVVMLKLLTEYCVPSGRYREEVGETTIFPHLGPNL